MTSKHIFDNSSSLTENRQVPLQESRLVKEVEFTHIEEPEIIEIKDLSKPTSPPTASSLIPQRHNPFYYNPIHPKLYIHPIYLPKKEENVKTEKNEDNEPEYIPKSRMDYGTLGFYNPSNAKVTLQSDYSNSFQTIWVPFHELDHANNIHLEARPYDKIREDEAKRDATADAMTGYQFAREFFGNKLWLN